MIHSAISRYLARTEAQAKRRTMSDAALIGWTLFIGFVFVAPAIAALSWVIYLPPIPGLS
jgi:hypothetical protein